MCNLAELEFYTVLHGRKTMVVEFDTTMSEQDFRSLVYYTSFITELKKELTQGGSDEDEYGVAFFDFATYATLKRVIFLLV